MRRIIAIDPGKYATKGMTMNGEDRKRIMFRTKMDDTSEEKAGDNKSCVVKYNGDQVVIGESAETIDYDKSKTKKIHKLAAYTAIAKLSNNNEDITLVVGCPLSIFNNVEERESYKEYMKGEGLINISLDGVKRTFNIVDVIACPESSGIIFKSVNKYKDKLIAVIDIGGLNTNCCIYDELLPVRSTSFTTNLGANILRNDLKQHLNSVFPEANLQDFQMEHIIRDGFIKSNKEESKEVIKTFLQRHINSVIDEAKRKGWDIRNIDFIFVGGGSKLLENEIKNVIPDAEISETAEWDNVEGFYEIGVMNE